MNYDEFKKETETYFKKRFPKDRYEVSIQQVVKNNGLILDGLCIFARGGHMSPTLYLQPFYERYQEGEELSEILLCIEKEYLQGMRHAFILKRPDGNYAAIRDQIILRLVNYEKNREILKDCPHILFYDLAVTFRWLAYQDDAGISTSLISLTEMERWGITLEQLYKDAMRNTKRIFPVKIGSLKEMLKDFGTDTDEDCFDLYVLSNEQGINGATCVLYEDIMEEIHRKKPGNFYLLPSSIHEMMICFDNEMITEEMLLSLVHDANQTVVTMGEVLSDNIYYYDVEKESLRMIRNDQP